jgi:hypothetical protein
VGAVYTPVVALNCDGVVFAIIPVKFTTLTCEFAGIDIAEAHLAATLDFSGFTAVE